MPNFQLQPHQREARFGPDINRMLLFHGLGSGKTCTSIAMAVAQQTRDRGLDGVVVVTPASLVANFTAEIDGLCGDRVRDTYRVNPPFQVVSKDTVYHQYKERVQELCGLWSRKVVIVDEVHRLLSYDPENKGFAFFRKVINCARDTKFIFLSATPISDPYKLVPLARLLLTRTEFRRSDFADIRTAKMFFDRYTTDRPLRVQNEARLLEIFRNRVSYFRRNQNNTTEFPTAVHHDVLCYMEPDTPQLGAYEKAMGWQNNAHPIPNQDVENTITQTFLLSGRLSSNLVKGTHHVGSKQQLRDRGIKFYTCLESVAARDGPFFLYSNFVAESGVDALVEFLQRLYGYSLYTGGGGGGVNGRRRTCAVIRASDPADVRQAILRRFNSPANADGRLINIVLGSPSSNEGISFKKLREIHILDPHWMPTTTRQIVARGVRFQSHSQVEYKRVDVFHYYATPRSPLLPSVDLHLKKMQKDKQKWLDLFETVLRKAAVENRNQAHLALALAGASGVGRANEVNLVSSSSDSSSSSNSDGNGPQGPARIRRIRRITRLKPFNPRNLNRTTIKRRRRNMQAPAPAPAPVAALINLTENSRRNVINLTR